MKSILISLVAFMIFFQTQAQEVLESKNFEAEAIKKIEVKGSFVDVIVSSIEGDRISFDGKIEGPQRYQGDFEIKSDLDGSTLKIWMDRPNSVYGNIKGVFNIKVPQNTLINISNSSGDIEIDGIKAKEIDLRCSSGDIRTRNLEGNIKIDVSSGDVYTSGTVGNLSIDSSSGDLTVKDLIGNLDCDTSSGSIELYNVKESFVTLESSSGDIKMDRVAGKFSIESTSGDIEGKEMEFTGDSKFDSTSGDIDCYLLNDINKLSFDLRSNSGDIKVGNNKRVEDRLILKREGFLITCRTTSGEIGFY